MKLLAENNGVSFSHDDVEFIKKHFRYPINSAKKIIPIIFGLLILIVVISFSILLLSKPDFKIIRTLPFLLPIFLIPYTLYRYVQSLFFIKIVHKNPALFNVELLKDFFKKNNFVVYQLPTNVEVFMLQGNPKNSEEHEIVIFIACTNFILVNSYIQSYKLLPNTQRKYKELVLLLQNYLQQHSSHFSKELIPKHF